MTVTLSLHLRNTPGEQFAPRRTGESLARSCLMRRAWKGPARNALGAPHYPLSESTTSRLDLGARRPCHHTAVGPSPYRRPWSIDTASGPPVEAEYDGRSHITLPVYVAVGESALALVSRTQNVQMRLLRRAPPIPTRQPNSLLSAVTLVPLALVFPKLSLKLILIACYSLLPIQPWTLARCFTAVIHNPTLGPVFTPATSRVSTSHQQTSRSATSSSLSGQSQTSYNDDIERSRPFMLTTANL